MCWSATAPFRAHGLLLILLLCGAWPRPLSLTWSFMYSRDSWLELPFLYQMPEVLFQLYCWNCTNKVILNAIKLQFRKQSRKLTRFKKEEFCFCKVWENVIIYNFYQCNRERWEEKYSVTGQVHCREWARPWLVALIMTTISLRKHWAYGAEVTNMLTCLVVSCLSWEIIWNN